VTGHQPPQALIDVLEAPLARSGLDLEGVEMSRVGRRNLVRVLVDQDGGVTLDAIADATHLVSQVLDESDVLGDSPYTLEVTSPGTDRPLSHARHWHRNVGRLVKVTPKDGDTFVGRVREADEDGVVLDVEGASRRIPYADVSTARVQVEFNRPKSQQHAQPVEEG
jgi:ribosome maturation factor RimP